MKRVRIGLCLVGVSAVALLSGQAAAQQGEQERKPGQVQGHEQGEGEMSPEMQKIWEAMAKLGTPGAHHEHLKPLAGSWNLTVKYRMEPDAEWTEEPSSSEISWLFGGRYLIQKVKGQPMPGSEEAFEGIGFIGYDNTRDQFFSTWADSMSTALYVSHGTSDASGKVITLTGESYCPRAEKLVTDKGVIKIINNDKWVYEMYAPGPDGKLFMSMEITYTRK